jgi:hypothetical protein
MRGTLFVVHGGYFQLTALEFCIYARLRHCLQNKLRVPGSYEIHESCALIVGGFLMKARIGKEAHLYSNLCM